ncbi:MAG: leucine-rich repeat domain-containing protein [Alistipes sp.]|nr:leucine-rich repeat domain-containing protein [Alistipes sp.]
MKKWLLLAVVGLMSACSKSDIEEVNTSIGSESPIFYASLEGSDETRTYLDENAYMRWTADDRVTIFFGENYNREFAFTGKTGATSGGFKQVSTDDPFYTAVTMSANYALYPYAADVVLEPAGYLEFSFPATQSYAEDSFGLNANTMVAVTKTVDDRFLQFKNVCGYLKLNLYGANVTVKSITLTGNNEEPLAGAATVTPTYGGNPTMAWAASGTTTSLTLDCGDDVKIGATEAEATPFWLVVPPTTFTKGFTVTITDTAGNTFTKSSTSKQTITRNISKNMPAFEVVTTVSDPSSPVPSNQIWYTSTDGKIVTPYRDNFGAYFVSNTYTNGKGVLTFDGAVTTIGWTAFYECTSLASIMIPEGVTSIGQEAFRDCHSLNQVILPSSLNTIGYMAFEDCESLNSIYLPKNLTEIETYAFSSCALKTITLPENLTSIDTGVFGGCSSLSSITFSGKLLEIGGEAFKNCTALQSISFPESLISIGGGAFYQCTSLQSISFPKSLTKIGEGAFEFCTSLKSIILPTGLTTLGSGAFAYCDALTAITLPPTLTTYSEVCCGCSSLISVNLSQGIKTISGGAFDGCYSLQNVVIPEGVTTIGSRAFRSCKSLASITLPEGVTSIEEMAFKNCSSLKSVYCKPTTPPKGGSSMFSNNASGRKIYVPMGTVATYRTAEYWRSYASDIILEE